MSNQGPATPELGTLKFRLVPSGVVFERFISYDYDQNFLVPTDQWRFVLSGDDLTDADSAALIAGTKVEMTIDDRPQTVGYIDEVRFRSETGGGTIVEVEGRDWFAPAVDSHVDPQVQFAEGMTLAQLVTATFAPFGVTTFVEDATADRNARTGRIYGTRTSASGKTAKQRVLHQTKPYPNEGAYAFASRVAQRFGLWIWPSSTVGTIILGKPTFDQEPRYQIIHKVDPALAKDNNILESNVCRSRKDQPSIIYASGFGGGGEFPKSTLRGGILNPYVTANTAAIQAAYPSIVLSSPPVTATIPPIVEPVARPLYVYDPESHNEDQLQAFLLRELSLRTRRLLHAEYVIEGHQLNGQTVAVDTIVSVDDDRSNLQTPLWVLGRRFMKAGHSGGTKTHLEMILPNTLVF